MCRTCKTRLLSGEIEYTVPALTLPAGGEVLICCARPKGNVALDA
jgi:ferredoxin